MSEGATPLRSNFQKFWRAATEKAGVTPELHLHDSRHTGATYAADTGASTRELSTDTGSVRIFNDLPRPRALFEGLGDDVHDRLRALFPSVREASPGDELYEDEIDVLVTAASQVSRAGHIHVVAFGAMHLGDVTAPAVEAPGTEGRDGELWVEEAGTRATLLQVPDQITGELATLVQSDLVPLFSEMSVKPRLAVKLKPSGMSGGPPFPSYRRGDSVVLWCTPFLLARDGSILAGVFDRVGGGRCWVLPMGLADPVAWVALALKEFRERDSERVPALPGWWEQPAWATPDQIAAREVVIDLDVERDELLKDIEARRVAASERVSLADEAALEGPTRLLRADGNDLAATVQDVLTSFGFEVENMDEHFPEGQRREDLRVRDRNHRDWEAIVEVKGYTGGAKVNDLPRLGRWSTHYVLEKGRLPSARWHVVNAFREMDPSARSMPIPDPGDLINLFEEDGVLIDTRELFSAWRAIATESIEAASVRDDLRNAHGRWEAPPGVSTPTTNGA